MIRKLFADVGAGLVAGLPYAVQLAGIGAAVVGVHILFGLGVALIVGGCAVTSLGALKEAGRI